MTGEGNTPGGMAREPVGQPGPSWRGDGALGGTPAAPEPAAAGALAALGVAPAPYGVRVAGFVIDQAVFAFGMALLVLPVLLGAGVVVLPEPGDQDMLGLGSLLASPSFAVAQLLSSVAYRWVWNALGWSPGKRVVGLRTIDAAGAPPGARRGLWRALWSLLSEMPLWLGYAFAGWDSERRTWHDRLARTWVVRLRDLEAAGRG